MRYADVLADLPGEAYFIGAGSARPPHFPSVYDPATGQFGGDPREAIAEWYGSSRQSAVGRRQDGAAPQFLEPVPLTPEGVPLSGLSGSGTLVPAAALLDEPGSGTQFVAAACTLMGDYNADGFVDAADYSVWRDTLGSTTDLRADGDGNLVVEEADRGVWLAHYGEECPALPGAFDILGPVGVQTQREITISWTPSAGATSYRFVLSQQPDASFPLYDEVVTGTSRTLLQNNGTVYAAVFAQNAAGETLASNANFQIVVQLPPAEQLFFVSGGRFLISPTPTYPPFATSFGSARAADYHCNSLAFNAGLLPDWDFQTLHFRALLTEGLVDVVGRAFMRQGIYYNTAGNVIANTRDDLMAGVRLAPILTQNATTLAGTQVVWTGANGDGSPGANAINWSTTSGTVQAGNLNGTGTNWLFQGFVTASGQQRLYCAGDRPEPPMAAPAVNQPAGASPRFEPQHQPEGASPRFEPSLEIASSEHDAPQFLAPIMVTAVGGANRGLAPAGSLARAGAGLLAERGGVGPAARGAVYVAPRRGDLLLVSSERAAAVDAVMEGLGAEGPGANGDGEADAALLGRAVRPRFLVGVRNR